MGRHRIIVAFLILRAIFLLNILNLSDSHMERIGRVLGKNRGRNQKSFPLFLSIKQLGLAIVFALFLLGCGNNGKTNNDVTDNTQ